jgi:transcriptional regulator with XRE-family HTH domain
MIQKMTGPWGLSANALAHQAGMSQTTLSRWLRDAARLPQPHETRNNPQKGRIMMVKRPADWTPEEKFNLVLEAAAISESELGAFLRRKGVHEAHLIEWRQMMLSALKVQKAQTSGSKSPENRRIRQLESELDRKEKALAETAALLVLQKKVQNLWGDEERPTPKKSGKGS